MRWGKDFEPSARGNNFIANTLWPAWRRGDGTSSKNDQRMGKHPFPEHNSKTADTLSQTSNSQSKRWCHISDTFPEWLVRGFYESQAVYCQQWVLEVNQTLKYNSRLKSQRGVLWKSNEQISLPAWNYKARVHDWDLEGWWSSPSVDTI